jgi:ribosomal protein S18 acetylase RimI-like enzyme
METEILFRKWNENDAEAVQEVLKLSWKDAYSSFIPQNDLDYYLDKTYSVDQLKHASHNPDLTCYVSVINEKVCGWLKIYESRKENRIYLSSIYVLHEYQKLKIGKKFFEIACREATKRNYLEIYIGVMIQNEIALNWYKKLGFNFFEEQPFTMGNTSLSHLIGKKILDK